MAKIGGVSRNTRTVGRCRDGDKLKRRIERRSQRTHMARAPILAAGGIVMREGARPLIALVQRRKDDGWVLPKGKLKDDEDALAAARREVIEETGHAVSVHEYIGAISYRTGGRRPKIVDFYRMQADAEPSRKPARDIRAVQWLPLDDAVEKLKLPLEQAFLRNVGPRLLNGATVSAARSVVPAELLPPQPVAPALARDEPMLGDAASTAPARKSLLQLIIGAFTQRRPNARAR